jgi:hypothetical protein
VCVVQGGTGWNGTLVTTSPLPWIGSTRGRAARRHRLAALLAVAVFTVAAGATIWQSVVATGTPSAAPPAPAAPAPALPADEEPDQPLDLPAPADARSDDAVVPPAREPVDPQPTPVPEPAPAPEPDPTPEPSPAPDPDPEPGSASEPDEPEAPAPAPVDLVAVQQRLKELGYLLGAADGVEGQQTVAAIMAFQRVNGLAVDGVVGPQTLAALEAPVAPELRGGPATRIEVDLTRQLAHVVRDGTRVVTLQISSGNGEPYPSASGGTAYARTPVGEFRIERRIVGVRESRLGTMYDPLYFHGGYAIHGSNSVPPYPASHGCIRVTRADGRWLISNVADGTPVHLHGGTHVFTPSR